MESVTHLSEASRGPSRRHHPHHPVQENGVGVGVEGKLRELDSILIIVAITRDRAAAAMGTVHLVAAVIMTTAQTMPEKTKVIQQYVWKMILQRFLAVQERKMTVATEQMAAVLAVELQAGV